MSLLGCCNVLRSQIVPYAVEQGCKACSILPFYILYLIRFYFYVLAGPRAVAAK
jgi:hypothetical protein